MTPTICISIDVERDYRTGGPRTVRGITEGLPVYLDLLRSHRIPFDVMVSGEISDALPGVLADGDRGLMAIGCHGLFHSPGYLNRMTRGEQEATLVAASNRVHAAFGERPVHFRAPNFSANGDTIRTLETLGFRVDSSVLPGRLVRKWRVLPLVDHRGAPADPYTPDPDDFPMEGRSAILEVPVASNPVLPGAPLGLGFLHAYGLKTCLEAVKRSQVRYLVFLAHSWEMVSWTSGDGVAPGVREAARPEPTGLGDLISGLERHEFVNLDTICAREAPRVGRPKST